MKNFLNVASSIVTVFGFVFIATAAVVALFDSGSVDVGNLSSPLKEMTQIALAVHKIFGSNNIPWLIAWVTSISSIVLFLRYMRELDKSKRNKGRFERAVKNLNFFGREFHKKEMQFVAAGIVAIDQSIVFKSDLQALLQQMCTYVADTFQGITGEPCHCTIKIFEGDSLITRARDGLPSSADRGIIDDYRPKIDYKKDTGFASILDNPRIDFFLCNDLRAAAERGEYINENPGWNEKYNATAITPICLGRAPGQITRESTTGFISVDSKTAEFPREVSKHILDFYATQVYSILNIVSNVSNKGKAVRK